MIRSSPSQKLKSITSIITQQKPSCTEDLNLHSNIKLPQKSYQGSSLEDSKQLIKHLLCKLGMLQEKQKQNQNIFLECLKSLRNQIASKDKINQTLRDQISLLKDQLTQLKGDLYKCSKKAQHQINRPSKTLNSSSLINPHPLDKQNIDPYLMDTLTPNKQPKKLSIGLSKAQDPKLDKVSKTTFKIEDFIKATKTAKFNEYYNNHTARQRTQNTEGQVFEKKRYILRNSTSSKKGKGKSIGIVKAKLFIKRSI